jgi:hypothetical protein
LVGDTIVGHPQFGAVTGNVSEQLESLALVAVMSISVPDVIPVITPAPDVIVPTVPDVAVIKASDGITVKETSYVDKSVEQGVLTIETIGILLTTTFASPVKVLLQVVLGLVTDINVTVVSDVGAETVTCATPDTFNVTGLPVAPV